MTKILTAIFETSPNRPEDCCKQSFKSLYPPSSPPHPLNLGWFALTSLIKSGPHTIAFIRGFQFSNY
jgi:hypothetical protein